MINDTMINCTIHPPVFTFTSSSGAAKFGCNSAAPRVFTFTAGPRPSSPLHFPSKPSSAGAVVSRKTRSLLKRVRPLIDIEGEPYSASFSKKKRRLRLVLITSRLSRPFSQPPTHIVDRGTSKIAVLARRKALGRNLLRKAAILNRVRREALRVAEQRERLQAEQAKVEREKIAALCRYGLSDGIREDAREEGRRCIPRRDYTPLPPSPLGLSNYDAFDLEDDFHDEAYADNDDESDGTTWSFGPPPTARRLSVGTDEAEEVYSDFNVLGSPDAAADDDEYEGPFSILPPSPPPEAKPRVEITPPTPPLLPTLPPAPPEIMQTKRPPSPDERMQEMLKEKERQREMMFLNFI